MKTQHWHIILLVFFLCSTAVSASTISNTLDNLTQDDGLVSR